jgi:hypothetical protein
VRVAARRGEGHGREEEREQQGGAHDGVGSGALGLDRRHWGR